MTNNPTIDGVSRELIELAVEYLKIHGERSSIEYSTAEDLQALLDAKPRIILSGEPVGVLLIDEYFDNREVGDVDVQLDNGTCERLAKDFPGQSLALYIETPEVAALQSTIARLEARIAELESGRGEPVAWSVHWKDTGEAYLMTRKRERMSRLADDPDFKVIPLYTALAASVQSDKYDDVLMPFLALMRAELHANAHKGDRPGWLQMDSKTAILEVFYHLGKLHQAVHRGEEAAIKEYAADVANMCMMLLDVCACLDATAALNAPKPTEWYDVAGDDEGVSL